MNEFKEGLVRMGNIKYGVEKDNVVYVAHSEKEALADLERMGGTLVNRIDGGWNAAN